MSDLRRYVGHVLLGMQPVHYPSEKTALAKAGDRTQATATWSAIRRPRGHTEIQDIDGNLIAKIGGNLHGPTIEERAGLIAAAPELLKACKWLIVIAGMDDKLGRELISIPVPIEELMRAAIARAEGRAQ